MTTRKDPLAEASALDRVHYATGMMLDADDFRAEQTYHRGRLARALAFLHGSGTAAGLNVTYRHGADADGGSVEELVVSPGLAVDRIGRLIELPAEACIRLDRWYRQQADDPDLADSLATAFKAPAAHHVAAAPWSGVVADVFIRFAVCERGKTPAFASGPFDALDAVQPARLRDGYELALVPRLEADLAGVKPAQAWPDFVGAADVASRIRRLQDAILDAWPRDAATSPELPDLPEYAPGQTDKTAVFLARVVVRADAAAGPGLAPARVVPPAPPDPDAEPVVAVDNHLRLFLYMPQALARALAEL